MEEEEMRENCEVKRPKEFSSLSAKRESLNKVPLEQISNKKISISP